MMHPGVMLGPFLGQVTTGNGDSFDLIKLLAAVAAIIAAGAGAGAVIKALTTERRAATRDDLIAARQHAKDAFDQADRARKEAQAADDKLEADRVAHRAEIDEIRARHNADLTALEARFVKRIDALMLRVNVLLDENVALRRRLGEAE